MQVRPGNYWFRPLWVRQSSHQAALHKCLQWKSQQEKGYTSLPPQHAPQNQVSPQLIWGSSVCHPPKDIQVYKPKTLRSTAMKNLIALSLPLSFLLFFIWEHFFVLCTCVKTISIQWIKFSRMILWKPLDSKPRLILMHLRWITCRVPDKSS